MNRLELSDLCFLPLTDAHFDMIRSIEHRAHSHPWKDSMLRNFNGRGACNYGLFDGNGVLVGYFYAQNIVGEISLLNIAVDANWQGNGIGRNLLNKLIELAEQNHAESIWLEVRESNQAAIALYENTGFHEVDRRINYYPTASGKEDALLMSFIVGM